MSTYLLTWAELEALVGADRLVIWDPRKQGILDNGRALYMVPEVHDAVLRRPWPVILPGEPRRVTRDRRQAMRAVLERFVLGGRMLLERDLAELGSKIRRPEHRGFWEFRSQGPWVQTRMFGFFARPGAFVATGFTGRDNLDFRAEHAAARDAWNGLTGGRPVMDSPYPVETAADFSAYLQRTDNA